MITRKGYRVEAAGSVASLNIEPDETCATGDWMILVVMFANTSPPSTPDGWTVLADSGGYGTRSSRVCAKIRASGETSYTVPLLTGVNAAQAVLMWGDGHDAISTWSIGTGAARASNATSTTCVAPGVSAQPGTVLAIANEATSATESSVSVSGATPWFFAGDAGSPLIHTTSASYNELSVAGSTGNVTVTYPNAQASNGWAIQVGITAVAGSGPEGHEASIALGSSGTLTSTSSPHKSSSFASAGLGALDGAAVPYMAQSAALSGAGTLSVAIAVGRSDAVQLSGSGGLAATTKPALKSSAALSGSGQLGASAGSAISTSIELESSGLLSGVGVASRADGMSLGSVGTLSATGIATGPRTASCALGGTGTLSATAHTSGPPHDVVVRARLVPANQSRFHATLGPQS